MKFFLKSTFWLFFTVLLSFHTASSEGIQWASKLVFQYNQYGDTDFSGHKVLGQPDALPYGTLNKNAFRLKHESGYGTLTVGFANPHQVSQVTIVENNTPGRIVKVVLFDTNGNEYEVYEGEPKKIDKSHNLFNIDLPKTPYKVAKIGIHVDTYVHAGWAQIDAVGVSENPSSEDLAARLGINVMSEDGTKISNTKTVTGEEPTFYAKKERLSDRVNSPFLESKPVISPDGNTLFFARKNCPYNTKGKKDEQDIYFSTLSDVGKWTEAKNMGRPLNDKYPNGVCSVTPDGNTLLVINAYGDGFVYDGVSISRKKFGGWSKPKVQEIEGYHNLCGYQDYFLTNTGKVMLMALQMEETYGDQDLYVSFLVEKDYWSKPVNLGPVINTGKVEFAPFLASDNKTLYFSSNGHGGYGESDIFYTKRLDDTWQNWSEPINIGGEINTPSWDGYYAVAAKGDYAYFVSTAGSFKKANLNPTDEDIYRIALREEAKPDPVILITGRVFNSKTKQPIEASILYESLPIDDEGGIANSNPNNGEYKIILPIGKKYGFRAESEGFLSVSRNEDFLNITEYTEIERDLYLTPLEVGQVIQLNNLFFVQSKAEMLPESLPELERLYQLMMEQPGLEIELGGHTDNQGIYSANIRLSQLRADAVKQFLLDKGIAKKRINAKGYGPSKPVASNLNAETRKQNRRVEITILKQ
jgi:outer membrane protein OmpA-like peptidoglycan-associated protein